MNTLIEQALDCLNEGLFKLDGSDSKGKDAIFTFKNREHYYKAESALRKAGWYGSNANPPSGKEIAPFTSNDTWSNIKVKDGKQKEEAEKIFKKEKLTYKLEIIKRAPIPKSSQF